MMAVSKEIPLSLGTFRVTSPDVVVRFRSVSYTHLDVYKRQVLLVSCKYIKEAFTKFNAILQAKGEDEQ